MNGCIYIHINKLNGKVYVGQSIDVKNRWRSRYRQQPYFHRALEKYGWSGFDHLIVVDNIDNKQELDNLEKLWIIVLRSTDSVIGYNLVPGGFSGSSEFGRMGGLAANKKQENRNRLKNIRTFESCSLGGKRGSRTLLESGKAYEIGKMQGNKNKESGHWDAVRVLGMAFASENGTKQGLKNVESGHLIKLNHLQWHVKRNIVKSSCPLCRE